MKNLLAAALMLGFITFASAQAPATTTTTGTKPDENAIKLRADKVKALSKARDEQRKTEAKNNPSVAKDPRIDAVNTTNNALSTLHAKPSGQTEESKPLTGVTLQTVGQEKDGRKYIIDKDGKKTYLNAPAKTPAKVKTL